MPWLMASLKAGILCMEDSGDPSHGPRRRKRECESKTGGAKGVSLAPWTELRMERRGERGERVDQKIGVVGKKDGPKREEEVEEEGEEEQEARGGSEVCLIRRLDVDVLVILVVVAAILAVATKVATALARTRGGLTRQTVEPALAITWPWLQTSREHRCPSTPATQARALKTSRKKRSGI